MALLAQTIVMKLLPQEERVSHLAAPFKADTGRLRQRHLPVNALTAALLRDTEN